jgi:hypothetical protein
MFMTRFRSPFDEAKGICKEGRKIIRLRPGGGTGGWERVKRGEYRRVKYSLVTKHGGVGAFRWDASAVDRGGQHRRPISKLDGRSPISLLSPKLRTNPPGRTGERRIPSWRRAYHALSRPLDASERAGEHRRRRRHRPVCAAPKHHGRRRAKGCVVTLLLLRIASCCILGPDRPCRCRLPASSQSRLLLCMHALVALVPGEWGEETTPATHTLVPRGPSTETGRPHPHTRERDRHRQAGCCQRWRGTARRGAAPHRHVPTLRGSREREDRQE